MSCFSVLIVCELGPWLTDRSAFSYNFQLKLIISRAEVRNDDERNAKRAREMCWLLPLKQKSVKKKKRKRKEGSRRCFLKMLAGHSMASWVVECSGISYVIADSWWPGVAQQQVVVKPHTRTPLLVVKGLLSARDLTAHTPMPVLLLWPVLTSTPGLFRRGWVGVKEQPVVS